MCPPISLPLRNARFLAATHIGSSPQARHKVNCPKDKRRSPLGDTRAAQLVCRVLIVHPVEFYIHFPFSSLNFQFGTLHSQLSTLHSLQNSYLLTPNSCLA